MSGATGYASVHRYDGAVIQRGRRDLLVPCTVQPRDVGIVADVRRYKFLTAPQCASCGGRRVRCRRPIGGC